MTDPATVTPVPYPAVPHPKKGGKGKHKVVGSGSTPSSAAASAAAAPSAAAAAASVASADALLDVLASRIDYLEGKEGAHTDENSLTKSEVASISEKFTALQSQLETEAREGKEPTEQLRMLMDLYRSEAQSKTVMQRLLNEYKEKLTRSLNQKRNLENLCRELQARNKKLSSDLKVLSVEQSRAHSDMKTKFEQNLSDIQTQLNKHTEERLAQQKENEKLRENLAQLLKFDSMREEHFSQQLKTKDLEAKLLEAKLAQQSDFAVSETRKAREAAEKVEYLTKVELNLRQQLSGYAEKFEQVQSTLSKSNDLFGSFKAEMEKTSLAMKKSEKEKAAIEKKMNQAQLTIIQMFEERQAERAEMDKVNRQKQNLENLCRELQASVKELKAKVNGQQGAGSSGQPQEDEATNKTPTDTTDAPAETEHKENAAATEPVAAST